MIDEYKKNATKLVSLKSVSADSTYREDLDQTAAFLKDLLKEKGLHAELLEGYGNPLVYGSYVVDPKKETCLIYGHYDVQPAVLADGWDTDPFTLSEKEGKFYGRGIMDDKCQFLIHILAIGKLIAEGKLTYNIKFLFEGEEELGSPHIEKFVKDHTELLSCDFALLSDGEMIADKPTIELSNRGVLNLTVTLRTATLELHSGIYGGAAPQAIYELSKLVSSLWDEQHRITVPGFYDAVDEIDTSYAIPFDFEEYKKNTGTSALLTEPEYDFFTQTGLRPSLTITGIYGGYIQEGHKTTIAPTATAKLSFRLVKSQDPKKIGELVKAYIEQLVPSYVSAAVTIDEIANPQKTTANSVYVRKAVQVLEEIYGDTSYYKYVGGTEPVLLHLQTYLHVPIVSIPFASEDGHMHGPNENFKIRNIEKGLEFSERFFGK